MTVDLCYKHKQKCQKTRLVPQAQAKMPEDKVDGLEDAIFIEMLKQLPQEKIHDNTRCFQDRLMGCVSLMRHQCEGQEVARPFR